MSVTIYHNAKCSKSRQTLALLQENGVTPTIVDYLSTPLSVDELRSILEKLGLNAKDITRTKEAKEEGLDVQALDNEALIFELTRHPRAIERPIVVHGDKAALGRPPEQVLEIL